MTRLVLASMLVLACAGSAAAQGRSGDETVSDDELIRWASNEVRAHEHREPAPARPPLPPASYLRADAPVVLPDQGGRDALRVLAEVGGGAIGALVGGGVATLVIVAAIEAEASPEWMMAAVGAGATLGAFAITSGVVLGAEAVNGRGNFGDAFVGQLVGSLASLPFVTLGVANHELAISFVAAGLLPLCGAILGYEISHASSSAPAIAFVRPTAGGALAGLAGVIP